MTPFWTRLDAGAWLALLALGGVVVVGVLLAWIDRQRGAANELRRLVLSQLLLAARRGLPLERALGALGEDLERDLAPHPRGVWGLTRLAGVLFGRGWARGGRRWQAQVVHDLASQVAEGDLACLGRVGWRAFPAPLPEMLALAQRRGTLAPTLEELSRVDDDALRVRGEVRGRLLYPAWILLIALLPVAFMELVLWPKLHELQATMSVVAGPSRTTELVALIGAVRRVFAVATPLLLVLLWLGAGALVSGRGRPLRWLPHVRWVQAGVSRARALRLLLAHLRAGVPSPEALRALGVLGALSPARAEAAAGRAADGAPLAGALEGAGLLPRAELERLPRDGRHELAALAALADAASDGARRRIDLAARATLPLCLLCLGVLAMTAYAGPHLMIQLHLEQVMPW